MHSADAFRTASPITEMAIVDTFTKLIFDTGDGFSASEAQIIQAFRQVEATVTLDTHREMGQYLRALGVREMIQLVTRVQSRLGEGLQALSRAGASHASILDRRAY